MTRRGPRVGVGVGVCVRVGVDVAVGVGEAVAVTVGLGVDVGVAEWVGEGFTVCVALGVEVFVGLAVDVGVWLCAAAPRSPASVPTSFRPHAARTLPAADRPTQRRKTRRLKGRQPMGEGIWLERSLNRPPGDSDHLIAVGAEFVQIVGTIESLKLEPGLAQKQAQLTGKDVA